MRVAPGLKPPLDTEFQSLAVVQRDFARETERDGVDAGIALARRDGTRSVYRTRLLPANHPRADENARFLERLLKTLIWMKGGYHIEIAAPDDVFRTIEMAYRPGGARAFDADFAGRILAETDFKLTQVNVDQLGDNVESSRPIGRHLDGYRVGFDLGASDRKAAAVINGETVYSEEVVWQPRENTDPAYHAREIRAALLSAAAKLPRLDAIGGSSAGVILENRPMVASLFRGIPADQFHRIKNVFLEIGRELGVPIEIANDGDVSALAGSMSLGENAVLGIAMGSSLAAGYVNADGNITGWLNELAFVPIDMNPHAPADEWSGDIGCGVQYLSQQAVFRLAPEVGIDLSAGVTLADKLKIAQTALDTGHPGAIQIWENIGVCFGYAVAQYAHFYDLRHVLLLGRVSSGMGGDIILEHASAVLGAEFPAVHDSVQIHLPDEKTRRVGQAVAAASLPKVGV